MVHTVEKKKKYLTSAPCNSSSSSSSSEYIKKSAVKLFAASPGEIAGLACELARRLPCVSLEGQLRVPTPPRPPQPRTTRNTPNSSTAATPPFTLRSYLSFTWSTCLFPRRREIRPSERRFGRASTGRPLRPRTPAPLAAAVPRRPPSIGIGTCKQAIRNSDSPSWDTYGRRRRARVARRSIEGKKAPPTSSISRYGHSAFVSDTSLQREEW